MPKHLTTDHWRGDLAGGLVSAIVYLPASIAWGMLAFSSLGSEFISTGVVAGLYSSIIVGLITAFYGGMPVLQSGARCANALIFSAMLIAIVKHAGLDLSHGSQVDTLLAIAFLAVVLSGLIQIGFGWLKLGQLIKFIPYPVSLGFINATALLIIVNQAPKVLTLPKGITLPELIDQLGPANLITLLFAALTFAVIWLFPKISRRIPAPVAGLLFATAVYQLLLILDISPLPGQTLGAIPNDFPTPDKLLPLFSAKTAAVLLDTLPMVLLASLSMAFMGALESLLTANSLERLSKGGNTDGGRVLTGLGLANLIAGLFGAIPGSGSPSRSIPSIKAGGSTDLAAVISSLIFLLVLLYFSSALAWIPEVAMAALMLFVGVQIADKWTLKNLGNIDWRRALRRNELSNNLLIILLIVIVAVLYNLIAAIMTGILIAIAIFVFTMSRSVIRDTRLGDRLHSRTFRHHAERDYLEQHGKHIAILDLEGPIFFGSAESIKQQTKGLIAAGTRYVILNLRQVTDIDFTGIRILQSTRDELQASGAELIFAHLEAERRRRHQPVEQERRRTWQSRRVWNSLAEANASDIIEDSALFPDLDRALEYCEDHILQDMPAIEQHSADVFTPEVDLFSGMSLAQIGRIRHLFSPRHYRQGAFVMRENDAGCFLLLIESGLVDVTIRNKDSHQSQRIRSLSSGTIVGEMALLDGKPRSANVEVRQALDCHILSVSSFNRIKRSEPDIAYQLLTNISLLFADSIRALTLRLGE